MTLGNEFIVIRVNAAEEDMGRFSIDTTGGDPQRIDDNNKILIYGHPVPWTSFTTIQIDGESYVFGGPTRRRAGRTGLYGKLVEPPHVEDGSRLVTSFRYGDLLVEQILQFGRSPSTRMMDSAKITYRITNEGDAHHAVGVRIMLDTMLGSNDGAPLLVGNHAVAAELRFTGESVPDYWQAFDSLVAPSVMAQGTLSTLEFSAPDSIHLANWGTLADHIWGAPYTLNRSFIREGEDAPDTAVALTWRPGAIGPGEIRERSTLYGLGGVTVEPGELAVGLTAPVEVSTAPGLRKPFTVVGYIYNAGGFAAEGVTARLELPEGLEFEDDESEKQVGALAVGDQQQVAWRVAPLGGVTGNKELRLRVETDNVEPNEARRPIELMGPPYVTLRLLAPETLFVDDHQYRPNPFPIEAVFFNETRTPINRLQASLVLPEGLDFPLAQQRSITLDRLLPGEEYPHKWMVIANGGEIGGLVYSVQLDSPNIERQVQTGIVNVPFLEPKVMIDPGDGLGAVGETLVVPVKIYNIRRLQSVQLVIGYDPAVMGRCYIIQRGTLQFGRWSREGVHHCGDGNIRIRADMPEGQPFNGSGAIVNLSFKPRGSGAARFEILESSLVGRDGELMGHNFQGGVIVVDESPDAGASVELLTPDGDEPAQIEGGEE